MDAKLVGAFEQMLRDFFPLGKKFTDLERIIGRRPFIVDEVEGWVERRDAATVDGVFMYKFIRPFADAPEYHFEVVDDYIIRVLRID